MRGSINLSVERAKQSAFGEEAYPDVFAKATALFESLAKNHCFQNANKRTAFVSLCLFLIYNGYDFVMEKKEAEDFVVDVVMHRYTFDELVRIIAQSSVRRKQNG